MFFIKLSYHLITFGHFLKNFCFIVKFAFPSFLNANCDIKKVTNLYQRWYKTQKLYFCLEILGFYLVIVKNYLEACNIQL